MSGDPNKRIKNPLFNPSVTGSTYEDFSQHAKLFPAQEPTPVPNISTEPEYTTNRITTPTFGAQLPGNQNIICDTRNQQSLDFAPSAEHHIESIQQQNWELSNNNQRISNQQGGSPISSLISSFTNIWKRSETSTSPPPPLQNQQQLPLQPAPAGAQTYFEQNPIPASVPLFSPNDVNFNPVSARESTTLGTPPVGPRNTYRRTGSKRPVYAQIPGLSNTCIPEAPTISSSSSSNFSSPLLLNSANRTTPPSGFATSTYFKPELSGYSTPQSDLSTNSTEVSNRVISPGSVLPPTSDLPLNPSVFTASVTSPGSSNSPFLDPVLSESFYNPISATSFINPDPAPCYFNTISASPFLIPVEGSVTTANQFSSLTVQSSSHPIMSIMPANDVPPSGLSQLPYTTNVQTETGLPSTTGVTNTTYYPVYHHWFFKQESWKPFSMLDSLELENAFTSSNLTTETIVATDGGRFDVNILRRERNSVYWPSKPTEVRRCSWFHKGSTDGKYIPYEENIATKLEEEFKLAFDTKQWHRKVELLNGDSVMLHGPDVIVLFPPAQSPDAWGNTPQNQARPRVVKRGMDEFDIDEGEPTKVDHLLFMVHGIGSVCDLKFRTVEEVVDEFRSISLQLIRSHYRSSCEQGRANRIEVLPISWHNKLHSEDTGIDKKLKSITLESIPKLRDFTNDTLLDILFYTSPIYCQTIISTVGNEINRIYEIFKQRNPNFDGGISMAGHSLGSLILFDILCHQHPEPEKEDIINNGEDIVPPLPESKPHPKDRRMSRRISYMMGTVGTGQPQLMYPHLSFQPVTFFALGSPIGMFVTIRGLDTLGEQFALPTCPGFFNIFHPYDPVAYRVESLVNPELSDLKPVLIPHHKGRKRMHLELKETMARVGADLKQRVMDSMKTTWNSLFQVGFFNTRQVADQPTLEAEVNKVLEQELAKEESKQADVEEEIIVEQTDLCLGTLNQGRRIDYVLQEAPLEFFNEYLFALSSHVCYWESDDTMLLILKEIYDSLNVSTDSKIPQQTMTIERPPPSPTSSRYGYVTPEQSETATGMDPTRPILMNTNLGPPPMSGFVKKT